jgi:hypothetical protein
MPAKTTDPDSGLDQSKRDAWVAWALTRGLVQGRVDEAVESALALGRLGATQESCAAAADIVGGLGTFESHNVLRLEAAFNRRVLAELQSPALTYGVDAEAVALMASRLKDRVFALEAASSRIYVPAPAVTESRAAEIHAESNKATLLIGKLGAAPDRTAPTPTAPPKPPRPPLGPSLRQFANEHSILLLSYTGAFLLIVATVLYELYGVASLGASMRFGGVLALDVVFAVAGWACLRSRRLRLVGHTYVAIAALLTPLVFVAAYVFFALQAQGISVDLALLVTGSACTLLYATLTVRLGSHAYGVLALLALAVAWLGGVDVAALGLWRAAGFAPLLTAYVLIASVSPRIPGAGDRFSRFAVPFIHAAAVASLTLLAFDNRGLDSWPAWVVTATLAMLGAGYFLHRYQGGGREASALAQGLLLVAFAGALTDAGTGSWRGALTVVSGAAFAVLWLARDRLGRVGARFGAEAQAFLPVSVGLGLFLVAQDFSTTGDWIPWRLDAALGTAAAVYLLAAFLGGGSWSLAAALGGVSLAWAGAVHDLQLGYWSGAAAALPALAYAFSTLPAVGRRRLGAIALQQSRFHQYLVALLALGFAISYRDGSNPIGGQAAFAAVVLTVAFGLHAVLTDSLETALVARVALVVAWVCGVGAAGFGHWTGAAAALLVLLYAVPNQGRLRATRLGRLASLHSTPFIYLGAAAALGYGVTQSVAFSNFEGPSLVTTDLVGWPIAALFGLLAVGLGAFAVFTNDLLSGLAARGAFGLAWLLTVHDLGLGPWRGTADTLLVALYALTGLPRFQLGRVGRLLAARRDWLIYASSAVAIGLTVYDGGLADPAGSARLAATLAGLAGAYVLFTIFGGGRLGAASTVTAAGLAWLAGAHALDLGDRTAVVVAPLAIAYLLLGAHGQRLGAAGGLLARAAGPAVHVAALGSLLLGASYLVTDTNSVVPGWISWPTPAVLAVVGFTYLGHWYFFRRPLALLAMAAAASLAVISAGQVLHQGATGASLELTLLAAAWAYGSGRTADRALRWALLTGFLVQALLPLAVVARPDWLEALLLAGSAAILVAIARRENHPWWLYAAGAAVVGAWFWAEGQAFPGAELTPDNLGQLFAPLAFAFGVAGLVTRAAAGRRWALPLYGYGALLSVVVTILYFGAGDLALAGRWLMAYAVLVYTVAAVERSTPAFIGAVVTAVLGVGTTLAASGAAPLLYPVALGIVAVAVYAGHLVWARFGEPMSEWVRFHRYLGLGGAAMTAVSGFALPDYTRAGTLGCALSGGALLLFGALVFFDGRRFKRPLWDYAALFTASLAGYFGARFFAASDPVWYFLAPGLALTACGLRAPFDARLHLDPLAPRAAVAIGTAMVLGVTAFQAFLDPGWGNTGLLVTEGTVAMVAGIGFRNRVLVIAGGAAVGLAGLRSLFVLVQQGLLFAAFGAVALVLLALGAFLALLRERFQGARTSFAEQWRDWN